MKSRIQREKALLYLLGSETAQGKAIRDILDRMGCTVVTVSQDQLGQTVGYLAGEPGYGQVDAKLVEPVPEHPAVLLGNFPEKQMERFFAALKTSGTGQDIRKAVMTEHNRSWSFGSLLAELDREHEWMGSYQALRQTAGKAREALAGSDIPDKALLERLAGEAAGLLQPPCESKQELDNMRARLEALFPAGCERTKT